MNYVEYIDNRINYEIYQLTNYKKKRKRKNMNFLIKFY